MSNRAAPNPTTTGERTVGDPSEGAAAVCRIGILTVSDRASRGAWGGPAIEAELRRIIATPWQPVYRLVPDERHEIEAALLDLCDEAECSLVVTTGGTGPAPRDITPEVTQSVSDKILPGFGELMRAVSLKTVPTAILSRQLAGTRGRSLIVNLPGAMMHCKGAPEDLLAGSVRHRAHRSVSLCLRNDGARRSR